MSSVIAIDIVLLPDQEAMENIIALNRELQQRSGVISHPLDAHACLPHVSLNMCGILTAHLPLVRSRLERAAAGMKRMIAKAILQTKHLPDGQTISEFRIEEDGLPSAHATCLSMTEGIELADVPLDAYVRSEDLTPETVHWTASFRRSVTENGYHPHITMNIGEVARSMEFDCVLDRIALCQLGNYCTCRKIIFELALPD